MRSTLKGTILGATVAGLLLAPQMAAATSVEEQLQAMQDRMAQMEEQLQATHDDLQSANERVESQAGIIREAGLEDDRSASSGLSSFLSDTEFYGWVNASYTLNTHMDGGSGSIDFQNIGNGLPSTVAGSHPQNMSFSVNQVWIGMDNAATADSRAGFHVDLMFGSDANDPHLQGFGCGSEVNNFGGFNSATNNICVFTANVSYLAPIGPNGVNFTMGKMATLLGAEVVETPWNFNITRGLVWGIQPVTNIGLVTSADLGSGFSLALGVIDNPIGIQDPDDNKAKSFTGQLAWSNDNYGVSLGGNWGDTGVGAFNNSGEASILDLVLSADPTDNLSLWLNFDWVYGEDGASFTGNQGDTTDTYGLAVAGRYAITDDTGIALRGEWVRQDNDQSGANADGTTDQWSITTTVDHNLTDNLMLRGEFRYDEANCTDGAGCTSNPTNANYLDGNGNARYRDQFLFLVDLTYEF